MGTVKAKAASVANDEIIDPDGLDLFRLTMMVITASICGGIFSLAGDMAAGGANTGAVIISWLICFAGVFALMMVFNGLSQARPDLTGGIYAYAAAGFGEYVGFNSAWGYWISACLSNVSFALLLFSALGYFVPAFGAGNNVLSIVCASAFLWVLTALVLRGVKEAAGINTIVTLAKLVPLGLFVLSIVLLGKFDPAVFMDNFWGEPNGPDFGSQVVSTMIALVWVFTGIEGAVVISGGAPGLIPESVREDEQSGGAGGHGAGQLVYHAAVPHSLRGGGEYLPVLLFLRRQHHPDSLCMFGSVLHGDRMERRASRWAARPERPNGAHIWNARFRLHAVPRLVDRTSRRHDHDHPVRSRHCGLCDRRARQGQTGAASCERQGDRGAGGLAGGGIALPALLGDISHRLAGLVE